MSLRQLIEPDCGGINPLVQFGSQLTRDVAFRDEGFTHHSHTTAGSIGPAEFFHEDNLVHEFLGQSAAPPQTFQMDALLQEMREIEAQDFHPSVINAPRVIDEVTRDSEWTREFLNDALEKQMSKDLAQVWDTKNEIMHAHPVQKKAVWAEKFFDNVEDNFATDVDYFPSIQPFQPVNQIYSAITPQNFHDEILTENIESIPAGNSPLFITEDWFDEFSRTSSEEARKTEEYKQKHLEHFQESWKKLFQDSNVEHSWFSEFSDYYDPYKEYVFNENNPMLSDTNALEKGKQFLAQGDIPNAVLCFESAAKHDPQNTEAWELLGISQSENEMDSLAIAALKKSLELKPNNMKVLMALAVSYTNESLQSQALKMLVSWLQCNPKYSHLIKNESLNESEAAYTRSLIRGPELKEIQNLFFEAVKQNPHEIDPDIQEALGVLFTLSSEYDKAVDCFRAALHVKSDNAKIWNRLGASLANGNRSVEAVEAYKRALDISPGFIRARYNVGIVCMNLKAYKEAVEHLLAALNLQATSTLRSGLKSSSACNQMSDTIWSTLGTVIYLMGKWDLQEAIEAKNLDLLNKIFNSDSTITAPPSLEEK